MFSMSLGYARFLFLALDVSVGIHIFILVAIWSALRRVGTTRGRSALTLSLGELKMVVGCSFSVSWSRS